MKSAATDQLDLPSLPAAARSCYKFHEIAEPLISVKKIVKNGCSVLFEATKVTVKDTNTGKPVLTGRFNSDKNLYTVPLHGTEAHSTTKPQGTAMNEAYSPREPHGTKAYSMTASDLYNKIHHAYGATAYEPTTLRKHFKYLHACAGYHTKRT